MAERRPHSDRIWSEIETIDAAAAAALQERRLREQRDYLAARSDFYRDKLAAHGVDVARVRTVAALADLPFTEKGELRRAWHSPRRSAAT